VRRDRPARRALHARVVRRRRLLPPPRRRGEGDLRRARRARAALRRRESRARRPGALHRRLVPQHVALRAEVVHAGAVRRAALADHRRHAAPLRRVARGLRERQWPLAVDARVRERGEESVQSMGRLLSVVLVTWNSAHDLPRCLEAIAQQTWPDVELIVVDNASTDGSEQHATIRNTENRGFAVAVNQGIAAARGEFVMLCNPDAFLEPDYLEKIIAALDEAGEEFGMATGKLLSAIDPTVIDSKGIRMTRTGRHLDIDQGCADGVDGVAE